MNSTSSRFRINALIQMARTTDDAEKRERYISMAESELLSMDDEVGKERMYWTHRNDAISFILDFLSDGERKVSELDSEAQNLNISSSTLSRAKTELSKKGIIITRSSGFGKEKTFYVRLCEVGV